MAQRKRVLWDEENLEENEEYRRLHPVTMRITEPKTPYAYEEFDEEGNFIDGSKEANAETGTTWDPKVNALVRHMKEELARESEGPVAPVSSTGRPMLSVGVTDGELLEKRHSEEFKTMRRAVYADEGANFKALLAHKCDDDVDDEDEDDAESEEEDEDGDDNEEGGAGGGDNEEGDDGDGDNEDNYNYEKYIEEYGAGSDDSDDDG
ncbi:hypothetical protein DQ04_00131050 [Trypanosoma grayi]|uniref:hypothetical protein n=1 Tax=Trypanosoma grayi TaxID=71804 RepID=UPI0004F47BC9|nr:hypothetical protein DQ04_00131050 [Trypanosoma grayi]KEG15246.1 hypothetical protein DQ04_00131050 [Trypanosoma grayi]